MSPRIVNKEQKRLTILDAAGRVFIRKGYHASRMNDIAEEAGIGKGTIYEYFKNKEEIIISIFDFMMLEYEERILTLQKSNKGLIESFLSAIKDAVSIFEIEKHAEFLPVFFEILGARDLSERLMLTKQMSKSFDNLADAWATLIEEGQKQGQINKKINARAFTRMMVSAIDGIMLHFATFRRDKVFFIKQIKELERMINALFEDGINKK